MGQRLSKDLLLKHSWPHAPAGHMYAVHPIPLSEVKAICKHTPSFGWQYIIVVLGNGLTLPPLYFSTGGVKGLMSALKQVSCPHVHAGHDVGQSSCSPQGAAPWCRCGKSCGRLAFMRQPAHNAVPG